MALTKEQVLEKMRDKGTVVLNVLAESDFRKLHILGSTNLPLRDNPTGFVKTVKLRYGKDKFFITYCAGVSCSAGPNAAKALRENGFNAEDYPGGIEEWSRAGFPTEGEWSKGKSAA